MPRAPVQRKTTKKKSTVRKGTTNDPIKKRAKELAADTESASDKLPHEILLSMARGEKFTVRRKEISYYKSGPKKGEIKAVDWVLEDYYPNYAERYEAAKAAASFYAPRLSAQTVKSTDTKKISGVMMVPMTKRDDWESLAAKQQEKLKHDVRE